MKDRKPLHYGDLIRFFGSTLAGQANRFSWWSVIRTFEQEGISYVELQGPEDLLRQLIDRRQVTHVKRKVKRNKRPYLYMVVDNGDVPYRTCSTREEADACRERNGFKPEVLTYRLVKK